MAMTLHTPSETTHSEQKSDTLGKTKIEEANP